MLVRSLGGRSKDLFSAQRIQPESEAQSPAPSGQRNRGVKLPAHLHPVTSLRVYVCGAVPPFPRLTSRGARKQTYLPVFFISIIR